MATYNSAGSGNFNVDATWTESGHPSTGDTAIINTGHTVTMTADDAVGSIDIKGTLTTDGTARTLTLDANAQGYICEHRGTVSTTINLVINSDFAGDKLIRLNNGGNGNFNDVSITLQSTSRKLTIGTEAASIDGDLTITQGIFDTDSSNNYALTVLGDTTGAGTLALNNSTYTGGGTGDSLSMTGTVTIGTSGVITNVDQLGESGGTITCTGSPTLGCQRWRQPTANWTPATSTLKIESNNRLFQTNGYGTPYNLEIDNSGNTNELSDFVVVSNNLTITAGTLDTSSSNHAITVTGDCDVTGTLTLNNSTVSVGALRTNSGAAVTQGSSGTLEITTGSTFGGSSSYSFRNLDGTSDINLGGTLTVSGGTYFEPKTAPDNASVLNHVVGNAAAYWVGKVTIGGNYTLNAGNKWQTYGGSKDFVVTGDVTLNGHLSATSGTLAAGSTGEMKFGSLTINSGGTYTATPLTTTINGNPGGYPNLGINLDGTFTHNNGTLKYTGGSGGLDLASTGNLYNFEHAPTGTTFITNNTTIENNLTMTGANFQGVNGNENLTVKGNVTINSSGQTMNFNGASEHTFGFLTILDGTYKVQNDTGGFTKVGGIRNVGGTVSNAV